MPDQNEKWGDRVDCAFLTWSGEFECKHCGIALRFTGQFMNKNKENNNTVREKTRIKKCMFCGLEVDNNE